ncbi:sugar transferase [Streptomyces sp. NPDC059176]|uniref:sugar transferase n=1 Tax=unclassified Streptomyces TaxID=2593676 RepID=UPI0036C3BF99
MWLFGSTGTGLSPTGGGQARRVGQRPPLGRGVPGKPGWYLPLAVAVDVSWAAVPVHMVFRSSGGVHAVWCAGVVAVGWVAVRAARGRYATRSLGENGHVGPVLRDWLVLVGMLAVLGIVVGERTPAPLAVAGLVPCAVMGTVCQSLIHGHLRALRREGRAVRRAVVIGEASAVDGLAGHLARRTDHEFVVVGMCPIGEEGPDSAIPVCARLDRRPPERLTDDSVPVLEAVRALGADLVFVAAGPGMSGERLRRLSWALQGEGHPLIVLPGLSEVARRRVEVSSVAGLTMLHVAPPLRNGAPAMLKAVTDRLGSALLLVLFAPVFAAVAVAVSMGSPGGVFYRQVRIGQGGRPFTMFKFRTMVVNAEQLKQDLAGANEQDGRMFKIRRDPRITRAGRLLRRYSLDELPQLYNVLLGHMSLVGPRPPLPEEVAGYDDVELRRLAVKPGLTGLWQVSGRSDLSWDETVALDLRYVDNWSPSVDFGVLCRTVRAVVEGGGAY